MDLKIKNPVKIETLRFGKFLPRAFKRANPLLGSWVSPNYINFPNRQIKADQNTLRGRMHNSPKDDSLSAITRAAFRENWFNWQIQNIGQITLHEEVQNHDNYKILILRFDIGLFSGESSYRRFLTLCSILEYFSVIYKERLKVNLTVFNIAAREKGFPFSRFSPRYRSMYLTLNTVGLLGSLTLLNKIYKLGKK